MNNLKYLEIQRLVRELQFLESDYDYHSEIIKINSPIFLNSVKKSISNDLDLKSISDMVIKNSDVTDNFNDPIEMGSDRITNDKSKSIYREIAKITHPDKVKNSKLNDTYLEAKRSYELNDIVGLYKILVDLKIKYNWSNDEIVEISDVINDIKGKLGLMKLTYTYKWILSEDKDLVVEDYIKSNYINSNVLTIH